MKRAFLAAAALVLLAVQPAAGSTPLQVSPAEVNFGRVAMGECQVVNNVPGPGCATQTITITNTGTETFSYQHGWSASSCERIFRDRTCLIRTASWGGFLGDPASTCLAGFSGFMLDPGESCTVVLIASPSRKGVIHGYFIMTADGTRVVEVPITVMGE
jgi:hypothetical protein